MTDTQSAARKHHFVPQFLLRRFARNGKVLSRIERKGGHGIAAPKTVCWERDLYTLEGPDHEDPTWIEHHSDRNIEAPAARALNAVVAAGGFPPEPIHREALARFIAWQFMRGPDARAFLNLPVRSTFELLARTLGRFIHRERLANMLGEIGLPVDGATGELRKNPLLALQTRIADRITATVRVMRLALVRFPDLALITSDRPVVQWGKIDRETPPLGVGLDVPHALSLHVDPRHALLFVPIEVCGEGWEERVVDGAPEQADVLNRRAAQWAWERVFHHPDHVPLRGQQLPHRASFDDELGAAIDESLGARAWPVRAVGRWMFGR